MTWSNSPEKIYFLARIWLPVLPFEGAGVFVRPECFLKMTEKLSAKY